MSDDLFDQEASHYIRHPLHGLLAPDAARPEGPNIGVDGRHLTIATVYAGEESLNAFCRSIALMAKFGFAGDVLLVMPPRLERECARAGALLSTAYSRATVLVASDDSDAHARNLAAEKSSTAWLLWLMPNVEIAWNLLALLQQDVATLGCLFLGVRSAQAGARHHVVVASERGDIAVCTGAHPADETGAAFLASVFTGAGYLLHVETFRGLGGYDESLSTAEDLDLSIRIFQRGLKVGVSRLGAIRLSGTPANTPIDPDAERRLAQKFALADPVGGSSAKSVLFANATLPRIALLIDLDDWAFANIAKQLTAALRDQFAFEVIPLAATVDVPQTFMMCDGADLIHVFYREVVRALHEDLMDQFAQMVLGFEYFAERFLRGKVITTSVYDHRFLSQEAIEARRALFNSYVASYYVASPRLFDIYRNIPGYRAPTAVLSDGVDLRLFRPDALDRFTDRSERPLVVGWVGNSRWLFEEGDPKGVHSIIRPALERLRQDGVPVHEQFADRQDGMIPHREMPAYYNRIDVLVCASAMEGTPNPVLEAMACGVPVISTDVGIVPDAFGPLQKEFILADRSVEALERAVRRLHADRSLLKALSDENLVSIQGWDWPLKAARFAPFFANALARKA